jgi:two-component system, OmpR family, sensor histidine kinase KdpD
MTELEGDTGSVEALAGRTIPEPIIAAGWTHAEALRSKAATLRIYLGMAPGVGKTFAMLGEARRAADRGTDVVIGCVETYRRPKTEEMLHGLERLPPRTIEYRGTVFEELDADAVIARRPDRVMIDELAHTNVPGSRRAKRWEDVVDILAAGIEVVSTLNIQHLESMNDVIAEVTGVRQRETVPDWLLDLADQVELVDMSPTALQRRMMHGNVYPDPQKAELALRRFFTTDNLTALRELALMRVADQVDEQLLARWSRDATPETRERVLVCVGADTHGEQLVRRGARMAHRSKGDLFVLHVRDAKAGNEVAWIDELRKLTRDLGGDLVVLTSEEPVNAVLAFAYRQFITQIVVGEPSKPRWKELLFGSFVARLIRRAEDIDVHVIALRER